ncbi:hypothetical protein ACWCXH_36570 [Kitasatospora sp. NPDC001660]
MADQQQADPQRGLGPRARVYRTPEDGKRVCVQLCIPAWGALASGGWQIPDGLAAPDLASLLGTYAKRVLTPPQLHRRIRTGAGHRAAPAHESGAHRGRLGVSILLLPPLLCLVRHQAASARALGLKGLLGADAPEDVLDCACHLDLTAPAL